MSKRALTSYGLTVKSKLLELNETQEWLISEIKKKLPDSYVDGSILYKIFIGEVSKSKIIPVINEILKIE